MPTIRADRPEIVAAVKDRIFRPLGYIGRRFFPIIPAVDKTGTLYFNILAADADPDTRANEYAEHTRATLGESSSPFTCLESPKTYQIPEAREKTYGGIDATDRIGVTAACRSVARGHEKAVAAKVLTTARYNNGTYLKDGLVLMGLQDAALSIGRYFGKTVLVGSTRFFQNFVLSADVSGKLIAIMGNTFDLGKFQDSIAGSPNIALGLLKAFLPFDEILVGDNEFWAPTGKTDCAVVAKLPPVDFGADPEQMEMIMREEAVYGVCPWYLPDPATRDIMFTCRSFFDDENDCDVYKAKGWYDLMECNAGAVKIVKFTAPAVSTTTTSTTTTTTMAG